MNRISITMIIAILAATPALGDSAPAQDDNRIEVGFWHTQRGINQQHLNAIIDGFNESQDTYRIVPQYVGGYDQIFRKTIVGIRSGRTPTLVTAYESMVSLYHEAGAVVDLDDYLTHPEHGFSPESLADIYPQFISSNRYRQYDNKLLSFPFTKSVLMLYYNRGLLEDLGFEPPPRTWDEFIEMCRAVTERAPADFILPRGIESCEIGNFALDAIRGSLEMAGFESVQSWNDLLLNCREIGGQTARKRGYAMDIDASTFDALVFSYGANVVDDTGLHATFDTPEVHGVLEMMRMMVDEGLANIILKGSGDDRSDLAAGRTAFMIRTSVARPYLARTADELREAGRPYADWDMAIIPHAAGAQPATVMFGGNIAMLKTSPEEQLGAWEFIKYFISTEVTAKWSAQSAYLPVRRSALKTETMQKVFEQDPRAMRVLDALEHAMSEPTVLGWQEVRNYITRAVRAVLIGTPAEVAATQLNTSANALLSELNTGEYQPAPLWFTMLFIAVAVGSIVLVARTRRRL